MSKRLREWLQEAAWVYPDYDEKFLEFLTKKFREIEGWEHTEIIQTKSCYNACKGGKYPQYFATMDPRGVGGDRVHLWRDGQTWWPMTGDFSFKTEELIELKLREGITEFISELRRGA